VARQSVSNEVSPNHLPLLLAELKRRTSEACKAPSDQVIALCQQILDAAVPDEVFRFFKGQQSQTEEGLLAKKYEILLIC